MGIVNRRQRNEIKSFLRKLDGESSIKLAERLLMLYSTRCIRLFPNFEQEAKMKGMGSDDDEIERVSIFIYHYQKGNEVPIINLMEWAQRTDRGSLWASLNMHFYTNLTMSYEGYEQLIRQMWDRLFEGGLDIEAAYAKIFPDNALPDNRDIPKRDFLANPRLITPHFLLVNSPITKELDERRALARRNRL